MHYLGSKKNHAKDIIAITCADRKQGQWYVEPFVGGGNVLNRVPQDKGPRLAGDFNRYMIALLDAVGNDGWEPPTCITFAQYLAIRNDGLRHPVRPDVLRELGVDARHWDALVGFAGTGVTFGSQWMSTYVHSMMPKSASTPASAKVWDGPADETICMKSRKAALTDAPGLRGAQFVWSSYDRLQVPEGAILYCDPPYRGTAGYLDEAYIEKEDGKRDQYRWSAPRFWQWANALVDKGHQVFVSEYRGPPAEAYESGTTAEIEAALAEARALPPAMTEDQLARWRDENPYDDPPVLDPCPEQRSEINNRIMRLSREHAERVAGRVEEWECVWSKEVSVNYASQEGASKKETERLFHRRPR